LQAVRDTRVLSNVREASMTAAGFIGLLVLPVVAAGNEPPYGEVGEVRWLGEQRSVVRDGDLAGRVDLVAMAERPHLYAAGPLEGLKGEVTVWDGKASLARWKAGRVITTDEFEGKACFLVYAQVPRWSERKLPEGLDKSEDLEARIFTLASQAGVPTDRPFPFLLRGKARKVKLHIVNKTDNALHNPQEHDKVKVPLVLEGRHVDVIGFYSREHAGVFTHHDSDAHMHALTADRKVSGHVDALSPGGEMKLCLPAPAASRRRTQ
jgi:acetolactate decarboxylase